MFSVHATPDEFRNATIIDQFGFMFEENSLGKSQDYCNTNRFWKFPFSKLPSTLKCRVRVLKSSGLKSVFKTLRFRDGFVWTVGLAVEIKLPFQLFFLLRVDVAQIKVKENASHPNSSRDELICCASLSRSPSAWVFLSLSLPAKSHLQFSNNTALEIFRRLTQLKYVYIEQTTYMSGALSTDIQLLAIMTHFGIS